MMTIRNSGLFVLWLWTVRKFASRRSLFLGDLESDVLSNRLTDLFFPISALIEKVATLLENRSPVAECSTFTDGEKSTAFNMIFEILKTEN